MATRPPLPVAQFAVGGLVDLNARQTPPPTWRDLFAAEDATGIWHNLSIVVRNQTLGSGSDADKLTQELFLELVTTARPTLYLEAGFTEAMIDEDLRLLCARRH